MSHDLAFERPFIWKTDGSKEFIGYAPVIASPPLPPAPAWNGVCPDLVEFEEVTHAAIVHHLAHFTPSHVA